MSADRNLLFGVLALQMDFISREQLVAAINAWIIDKNKSLGEILVQHGAMKPSDLALWEPLIVRHIEQHGNDAQKSLAALSSVSSVGDDLRAIEDSDVQVTLSFLGSEAGANGLGRQPQTDKPVSDRFRILRSHARGGLGEVFVAKDVELNREVALKEIQASKDRGDSRARFVFEAEVTGGLEHPGIVPVYGLGHYSDGRPYYAMRFIKGDNLGEAIKRFHGLASVEASARREVENQIHVGLTARRSPDFDSLEFRRLLQRFIDVCNAVAYAHSRGVLHRDLKPGNIMLGKYGETLVVDWGLAKTQASRESERPESEGETTLVPGSCSDVIPTQHGSIIGTPAYMSPEQTEGKLDQLGPASDVYSLGATLYHLLVGKPPNANCDVMERIVRTQKGHVAPPGSIHAMIPKALDAICMKAMALRPADRYATAQALTSDIEHWLADEPVSALAEPITVRTKRWMRKHPGTVAALAASLIVGILGLGGGLFFVNAERARTELARQDEEKQRIEATRQRDETEAVLGFVENQVFAAARPENQEGGLGHDVSLARAIQSAVPFVADGFQDRPLTEARLRRTLGTSFWYLNKPEIAEVQYRRARELYTTRLGPDHGDTLSSMFGLANSYSAQGRHVEASALYKETLELQNSRLGPEHIDSLATRHNLALSYGVLGRHVEALALDEETLKLMKAMRGPDHPHTFMTRANLATGYLAHGRHAESLALFEEAFAQSKAKLGLNHAATLKCMTGLATCYDRLGRNNEALTLRQESLQLRRDKLGTDHQDTLESMSELATSYFALGRRPEALALREETLKLTKAKLGPDHPQTLACMNSVASSLTALGRHTDALALYEETLKLRRVKLGLEHPDTVTSMNDLGIVYAALRRDNEALALRQETLRLRKDKLGPNHPETFVSMHNLAISYYTLGRIAEAQGLFEETLKLRNAMLGPDHPQSLASMSGLAACYAAQGRLTDALALDEETVKLQKAKLGPDHPETIGSIHNLARSYAELGRVAEALALQEETLNLMKSKLGPDHPDTLNSHWGVITSLISLKRLDDAMPKIDEVLVLADMAAAAGKRPHPGLVPKMYQFRLAIQKDKIDAAGCQATAEMWEKLNRTDAASLFRAACFRAVCTAVLREKMESGVEEQADQSIAWLQKAIAAGYKNVEQMKKDKDLDPLRDREDFKKLLAELEAKVAAEKKPAERAVEKR